MSIDLVESRIATLQSQLAALATGQTPSVGAAPADAATTLAFADVLDAQNGDLSSLLDQVGGGVSTSGSPNGTDGTDSTALAALGSWQRLVELAARRRFGHLRDRPVRDRPLGDGRPDRHRRRVRRAALPRRALQVGRHEPGHRSRLLRPGPAGDEGPRCLDAAHCRPATQCRPAGRLPQGRQAGRPAGLRLAPHRHLRRRRQDAARAAHRRPRADLRRLRDADPDPSGAAQ